jgi:hypothetical protein
MLSTCRTMPIHSMRDHPNHCYSFNGGLWGAVKGGIPNLKQRLDDWKDKTGSMKDMEFLGSIWPEVRKQVLQHDSYCCKNFHHSKPFSTQRFPNFQHCGQVFLPDNTPRRGDIDSYLRIKPAPSKCRLHEEWTYG